MRRPVRGSLKRFAAVAVSTGVSLALVSGIGGPATARAASYSVVPVAAIEQSPSTIGIAEGHDFYLMSDADIERTLDAMQALGVENVRIGIFWADIEAEEGVFNWDNVDRMVDAATERGMGILGTILYTPGWAGATTAPEETEWASHPDPVKFGNFVREVAEEYEGRISTYEIWNEPTTNMFWDPADPAAYTDILKAGYQAIKAVDPSALVIAGSVVAGPTYEDGSSLSPVDFIEGMYDNGAQGYFDAISYHPYLYTMPFSNGANQPDEFDYPIEQLNEIRNLMIAKGDGHLKVWITEYGQPTNTVYQNTTLTEQQQAAYIEDLLRTWQNIDGAGPVFIYQTRDTQTGNGDPDGNLGLYDSNWDRKPAADILEALIEEFNPPTGTVNPLQAFLQRIVRAISQALAFVPNLITQVVQAVVNLVGSILGISPAATRVSPEPPGSVSNSDPETADDVSQLGAARTRAAAETDPGTGTGTDTNTEGATLVESLSAEVPLQHSQPVSEPTVQVPDSALDERSIAGDDKTLTEPVTAVVDAGKPEPVTPLKTDPEFSNDEQDLTEAKEEADSSDVEKDSRADKDPDDDNDTDESGGVETG
jgi:hypothetical protein